MHGRRSHGIGRLVLATMVVGLGMAAAASAEEGQSSRIDGALHKLGRGIANIATCPAELIRTPELVGQKDGYLAAMTAGIAQGAWRTVLRGVTGIFEVATFYAEIPKDYAPLMKPEYVFAHGDWVE